MRLGSFDRHFIVHVPATFNPKRKLPVVIMLHGAGGTGQQAMEQTGWDRKADREDFIAVFPDGVAEYPKLPPAFCSIRRPGTRVRGAMLPANATMATWISSPTSSIRWRRATGADPHRIFVTGFSNGASMTFRAGVELSDKLAAIAPVAGHLLVHDHQLKRPTPMLYIIGRDDPLELPNGGVLRIRGEEIEQPPIEQNLAQWRQLNGCDADPASDARAGGVETISFDDCRDGAKWWSILSTTWATYGPAASIGCLSAWSASRATKSTPPMSIWNFFKAHPKP